MTALKKWPKIRNSYDSKHLSKMLHYNPQIENEAYVITEKIDGSNISWTIYPDGHIRFASRNHFLPMDGSFHKTSIQELYNVDKKILENLAKDAKENDVRITLYGELFGPGIQNRINYGGKRRILYFGMKIDDDFIPWGRFQYKIPTHRTVPVVDIVFGLDKAIAYNVEKLYTSLTVEPDVDIAEGVVIAPLDNVYYDGLGRVFMLKKKSAKFEEKSAAKHKKEPIPDEVLNAHDVFLQYINENRLLSVISKEGEPESDKDIGKYIRLMIIDAKEDFMTEHSDLVDGFDKKELKIVFNVGSECVKLIKDRLYSDEN